MEINIKLRSVTIFVLIAGGFAYYRLFPRSGKSPSEAAYVLPDSVQVMNTPAEVRVPVGELRKGERVDVVGRTRNWVRVRLPNGRTGWVEAKALLDSQIYDEGQRLMKGLSDLPAQAEGHPAAPVNLHLEPSRDSPQIALLDEKQRIQIFGRRLVERPTPPDRPSSGSVPREVWYLVRADSHAGWLLGRLVTLSVPEALSIYAQDVNMVAWLVLNTVEDEGRRAPEYVVADRIGTPEVDFNHIRVFTWWKKKQAYATAYVESDLLGFFPIRTARLGGIPYFRLRLVDSHGRKFQKVYGLFDTITRPVGIVDGWTTDAMPTQPMPKHTRRR